jgi:hypothetical protein
LILGKPFDFLFRHFTSTRYRCRYADIVFDEKQKDFVCPACANTCNCTVCSRKRGEEYIPPPRNASSTVSRERPSRARAVGSQPKPAAAAGPSQPPIRYPSIDFSDNVPAAPPTEYWATVYRLSGEKVGTAWKGDPSESGRVVVIASPSNETSDPPLPSAASHSSGDT